MRRYYIYFEGRNDDGLVALHSITAHAESFRDAVLLAYEEKGKKEMQKPEIHWELSQIIRLV